MATFAFSLTVSEGKRLIAKGILEHLKEPMAERTVLVTSGTTNACIAEELLGADFPRHQFVTGRTLPSSADAKGKLAYTEKPVRVRKGTVDRCELQAALEELGPGDVVLKGANVISGDGKKAGVLVGNPMGGTMGALIGIVIARRARLIHPAGLEKAVCADIEQTSRIMAQSTHGRGPALFVSPGEVFTECSAIEALFPGVTAHPYASGGIMGAEGAAWILAEGDGKTLAEVEAFLKTIHGEPPFI